MKKKSGFEAQARAAFCRRQRSCCPENAPRRLFSGVPALAVLAACSSVAHAAEPAALPPPNPSRNVYFGDLHLHTSMSFDAHAGRTSTLPEDSYRFARGETVDYFGRKVTRNVPLDFLAVTDHAEYLGMARVAADPKGPFRNTDWPQILSGGAPNEMLMKGLSRFVPGGFRGEPPIEEFVTDEYVKGNWQRQVDAAQKFYQPGKFTTFVAFEWSAMPNRLHLHRNVIFRGPKFPDRPFSAIDSMKPEDLWQYADNQRKLGNDTVLIPHNPNLSGGLMFAYTDSDGKPISRSYAETRARNERLAEISQNKGTSETRPELSPNDEFAGFEVIEAGAGPESLGGSFLRQALRRGLEIDAKVGVNPFAYGLIGSSDFHSGLSATEENNYPGGLGVGDTQEDPARILTQKNPIMGVPTTTLSAGALTGVWAEQNTRESIFDALKRKEAFATSGGRISVRLFAGWNYAAGMTQQPDWVRQAYAGGVSMGADLPPPIRGARTPRFLVHAFKDPNSGNLDRIQIVKVGLKDGQSYEQVFDVAWSGNRKPDGSGKLPAVGNTVDVKTATYTNDIGAAQLVGEWTDPQFDRNASALYYARVLEIPTPRWSTHLAAQSNLPVSKDVPPTIQERAWTSPIFYTGKKSPRRFFRTAASLPPAKNVVFAGCGVPTET
jgi:hypothetical protein